MDATRQDHVLRRLVLLFACGLGALFLWAGAVHSETPILSAAQAHERLNAGEMVMLDIRTREEWATTGVAQGAWPVSMHEQGFPEKLQAILDAYPSEQIALICATGGRSNYVAEILEKNGFSGIVDVSEGMNGNRRGPGWVAGGFPVTPLDEAMAGYTAAAQAGFAAK